MRDEKDERWKKYGYGVEEKKRDEKVHGKKKNTTTWSWEKNKKWMRKKRELIFCKSEKMRRAKREKIYYLLAYEKEKLSGNGKKV